MGTTQTLPITERITLKLQRTPEDLATTITPEVYCLDFTACNYVDDAYISAIFEQ